MKFTLVCKVLGERCDFVDREYLPQIVGAVFVNKFEF